MDIKGFLNQYQGLSELTRKTYRNTLETLQTRIQDSEPTKDEVREFLREFKTGTTLQRHKAAIKRYFTYKQRPWLFDSKEFISSRRRLPKYHDREVVEKLIETADGGHDRMAVRTLFMAGLRIAELMNLKPENVEQTGIKLIGKGDKERYVPIPDRAFMAELREYAGKAKGKLFPGKYFDYWLLLRRLCQQAGVGMVSPHSLRHSRAVDLLNRGISLGGVQTFLGHQQAATTLIYGQLTQRDLQKELERLEE